MRGSLERATVPAMRQAGKPTAHPGVWYLDRHHYRIRAKCRDPATLKVRQVERVVEARTPAEAAKQRAALADELRGARCGTRPTLSDYARLWLESRAGALEAVTSDGHRASLEFHILPALGDLPCDALRPYDVQAWVNALNLGAGTVRRVFGTLRCMMRDAMAHLGLERDPCLRITLPAVEEGPRRSLRVDEVRAFLDAAEEHEPQHAAMLATMVLTGLRYVHAAALRWDDVDLDAGLIAVRHAYRRGRLGEVSRKKRAPLELPIAPDLVAVLRRHRDRLKTRKVTALAGYVFPGRDPRRPVNHFTVWQAYQRVLRAAGLDAVSSPHKLRGTCTDLLRRAGVDPTTSKAITGHVTDRMREHYSSVGLDEKRAALAKAAWVASGAEPGADLRGGKGESPSGQRR